MKKLILILALLLSSCKQSVPTSKDNDMWVCYFKIDKQPTIVVKKYITYFHDDSFASEKRPFYKLDCKDGFGKVTYFFGKKENWDKWNVGDTLKTYSVRR